MKLWLSLLLLNTASLFLSLPRANAEQNITTLDCNGVMQVEMASNVSYRMSNCLNTNALAPLTLANSNTSIANVDILVTGSTRPVLVHLVFSVDNISITFINCTIQMPSTGLTAPVLVQLGQGGTITNIVKLTLVNTVIRSGSFLQLLNAASVSFLAKSGIHISIVDNSDVQLLGVTAMQISNVNSEITPASSSFVFLVNRSTFSVACDDRAAKRGAILYTDPSTVPFAQASISIYASSISCVQQNLSDLYTSTNFGCFYLDAVYENGIPQLSVAVTNNTVLNVHGMKPSLTSSFSEAHFVIIHCNTAKVGTINPFPVGYGTIANFNMFLSELTAYFSSGSKTTIFYGDLGNFVDGSFIAQNVTLHHASLYNSAPKELFRLASFVYVTAQSGFQNFNITINDSNVFHQLLSGAVWANDTVALEQRRSLSNIRSALIYVSYLKNTTLVVSNSQLNAQLVGGAFAVRGPRDDDATVDLKILIPLGIVSTFLVQLQSEAAIFVNASTVVVVNSTLVCNITMGASSLIIDNANMTGMYKLGISVYGFSAGIVYLSSIASNISLTVAGCTLYQDQPTGSSWWWTMRNTFSSSTLVNITGIVVGQAVEASLSAKMDYLQTIPLVALAVAPYLGMMTDVLQQTLAVVRGVSVDITDCVLSIDPYVTIGSARAMFTSTPSSIASVAAAVILPNFMFDGTQFTILRFQANSTQSSIAQQPFVSFIGCISLTNATASTQMIVTDSWTKNGGIMWAASTLNLLPGCSVVLRRNRIAATASATDAESLLAPAPISPNIVFFGSEREGPVVQLVLSGNELNGFQKIFTTSAASSYIGSTARDTTRTLAAIVSIAQCNAFNSEPLRVAHVGLRSSAVLRPYETSSMLLSDGVTTVVCSMSFSKEPTASETRPLPQNVFVPPTVPTSTGVKAIASAGGVVVAVVASQLQTANPVFLQVAMLAMRLINGGGDCSYDVTIMESPTGLTIGDEDDDDSLTAPRLSGAIVGDSVLFLCTAFVIVVCGCGVVFLEVRQQRRVGIVNPETAFASQFPLWRRVFIRASLPGALVAPLSLVLEPIISSSLANLIGGNTSTSDDNAVARAIGVLGMSTYTMLTAWLIYNAWHVKGCRTVARPRHEIRLEINTDEDNSWVVFKKLLHRLTIVQHEWKGTSSRDGGSGEHRGGSGKQLALLTESKLHFAHFGATFEPYSSHRKSWFFLVEFGISFVCGVLGAIASQIGCSASLWVLLVVSIGVFIAGVAVAPYSSTMLHVTFVFNAATTALICLIGVIASYQSDDNNSGQDAALIITYIQLALVAVQMLIDWAGGLLHGTSRLSKLIALVRAILAWGASIDPLKMFDRMFISGDGSHDGAQGRVVNRKSAGTTASLDTLGALDGSGRVISVETARQLEMLIVMITSSKSRPSVENHDQ